MRTCVRQKVARHANKNPKKCTHKKNFKSKYYRKDEKCLRATLKSAPLRVNKKYTKKVFIVKHELKKKCFREKKMKNVELKAVAETLGGCVRVHQHKQQ